MQEDLLLSKIITSITDKELEEKYYAKKKHPESDNLRIHYPRQLPQTKYQSIIPSVFAEDKEMKQESIRKIQTREN